MLGKSCGGNGIFFYVRLSNPKILTVENFLEINTYFINHVFRDLNLCTGAKGINRNQDEGVIHVICTTILAVEKALARISKPRGSIEFFIDGKPYFFENF